MEQYNNNENGDNRVPPNLPTEERRETHEEHEEVETPERQTSSQAWDFTLKSLIVIGLILLLTVGILLPIKLVPDAISTLTSRIASIFSRGERGDLVADKSVVAAGETLTLTWKAPEDPEGVYRLTYSCVNGVTFAEKIGEEEIEISCDSPLSFAADETSIQLIPHIGADQQADVTITLTYRRDSQSQERNIGSVTVTVVSGTTVGPTPTTPFPDTPVPATPATTTPQTPTQPTTPSTPDPAPTTPTAPAATPTPRPDLSIRLVATGIVNPSTGAFVATQSIKTTDRVAVQFEIVNIGNATAHNWRFNATMPTQSGSKRYESPIQANLAPGARVVNTISFDNIVAGQGLIVINADPENAVAESSEMNNTLLIKSEAQGPGTTIGTKTDLAVTILGTGIMRNGTFRNEDIDAGDTAAVRFEVKNTGGTATGTWSYELQIPGIDVISKKNESSLAPGEKRTYTVNFTARKSQDGKKITVEVDPSNKISEISESNNTGKVTIYVN